ncbi:hypothetical protein [Cruoricaptor ignavus]|uniref:hypothetical protein n=1 Tax=Cruoricaptor ignavus TaxID=1118202 RepID=UPI0013566272|nr:hypothetical protein [Cruoricaptor ignavus]
MKTLMEQWKSEENPSYKTDLKAVIVGIRNFLSHSERWNLIAEDRLENFCADCDFFVDEKIASERVADRDIPGLSGKSCGDCGCVLSFKLRQSVKPCRFWKE